MLTLFVPEGGENQVAIDLLVTKVRDIIRKTKTSCGIMDHAVNDINEV